MKKTKQTEHGFALVELVISLAIFGVIMVGIVSLVGNMFTASTRQSSLLSDEDQARKVAFQIINELRNAQSGNDGSYSITTAGAQELIFFSNLSNGGSMISKIRYYISNGNLYRTVTEPSGNPLTYTGSGTTNLVQKNVANASTALFLYYDGNYNASTNNTALSQPVNLTQVKHIRINLMVFNKAGVNQTNTYTVSTSGTIRNLKTNLGN